jgi:hypothetical protein
MAKRAKNTPAIDVDALVTVFCTLASFDSSETDPVTVQEMADELDAPLSENAFTLLETLADAELIEFERGKVWISREDVTEENAEDIAVNGLNGFEPKSDSRKRLEYAVKVAESQDAVMAQAPEFTNPTPVEVAHAIATENAVKAVTPVIAENGEKVTIPVDFDDPSKGRRELDASKGERVISEETITVKVTPKPERLPEIDGLDQFIDAETGDMVYESRIVKMGLALPEPDSIPERPEGVNANTWDMAHTAITQSARDYWLRKATEEMELNEAVKVLTSA